MKCFDIEGNEYELGEKIGQGGQGAVYSVEGNDKIVLKCRTKMFSDEIETDEALYEKYLNKISELIALNIKHGIAVPEVLLKKPYCGYIMRFMEDMIPIEKLLTPQINFAQSNIGEQFDYWYNETTGGYKRRLLLLREFAKIMKKLYDKGLVYGDLSPGNIFVSVNVENTEVWLIDSDNIHCENENAGCVYTNLYNAPELVNTQLQDDLNKTGNTIQSDIYSFAILAYQLLTLNHPFLGKLDYDNDVDDWENSDEQDIREKIAHGIIPWINDSKDTSNRSEHGLPVEILGDKLKQLFIKTFEEGKLKPHKRPNINMWLEAIQETIDNLKPCENLADSREIRHYYLGKQCLWCGVKEKGANIQVKAYNVYGVEIDGRKEAIYEIDGSKILSHTDNDVYISNRIAYKKSHDDEWAIRFVKEFDNDGEFVSYKIITNGNKFEIRHKGNLVEDGVPALNDINIITEKHSDNWREIIIKIEE